MRFPSSLRSRLVLASLAVATIALVGADASIYGALRASLYRQLDTMLDATNQRVTQRLGANPGGDRPNPAPLGSPPGQAGRGTLSPLCTYALESAPGTFVEVRRANGTVVSDENCPAFLFGGTRYSPRISASFLAGAMNSQQASYASASSVSAGGPIFRIRASSLPGGGAIVVGVVQTGTDHSLDELVSIEAAVTAMALLVSVLASWWLVRVGLTPLRDLEETAGAISRGELHQRVTNTNSRSEIGRVGAAFNLMVERISAAFAQRDATEEALRASQANLRRFVADASHELRTPIAAMSAYAQLFDAGAVSQKEDIDRIARGINVESRRMGRLVEDLLILARLDEHRPLANERVELIGVASEAIARARALAPERQITLIASDPVEVLGDEEALCQVADNLLANVRAHTSEGVSATIRVRRVDGRAVIEVEDEGDGLSDEALTHVFERFYRADPSRARSTGGSGLGLSIVLSIVEAHRGTVTVANSEASGARFTVILDAIEAPADVNSDE